MAKRRRRRKKGSSWDPISPLIDIAGGIAMGMIAAKMEDKYHYTDKGKINPYAVSAIGIATGTMKTNKDIMRTGAWLGAMGSFDVDADDPSLTDMHPYIPEDPIFDDINTPIINDNHYAWRMNCEDGSPYGVSPQSYESKVLYDAALKERKDAANNGTSNYPIHENAVKADIIPPIKTAFARVSRLDTGANEYYLLEDAEFYVGEQVLVPTNDSEVTGIILSIETYSPNVIPNKLKGIQLSIKKKDNS